MRWCADRGGGVIRCALVAGCLCAAVGAARAAEAPPPEWTDLAAAFDAGAAAAGSPVDNLTLPLDHYDSGRVRAVLRAERATVAADGFVRAEGVRIDLYDEKGGNDGQLTAERCLFNREEKRGYCRGGVALVRREVELSGQGLYWSVPRQRVVILSQARVVVKQWKWRAGGTP